MAFPLSMSPQALLLGWYEPAAIEDLLGGGGGAGARRLAVRCCTAAAAAAATAAGFGVDWERKVLSCGGPPGTVIGRDGGPG